VRTAERCGSLVRLNEFETNGPAPNPRDPNQAFDRDQSGRNESGASRLIIPDEVQPCGPITGGYGHRFGIGGGIDIRV
jgi:hypothetical protein